MGRRNSSAGHLEVLRHSRFAARLVAAHPDLGRELDAASREGWSREAMQAFLAGEGVASEPMLHAALRRLRQRVMLRLIARDLSGAADLGEVCTTMTVLAEVALAAALEVLEPMLEADFGVPYGESGAAQRLIVVGMGKLGGGELNVSSDVDLVFVYPEEGETRGARALSNHEFFARLGRRLIAALADRTAEGQVFRVDMRLRPWGDSGPLVISLDALEQYLVTQGREWERYAWIKGRALCGDATALEPVVRPFVYRKYLDFGAFAAMRELHAQIRTEVARRDLADHVKLGPGGIREIEFIAQAFQLIRGGRDADLRVRPTLQVLSRLAHKRLLPQSAVADLSEAYRFLRRVEHRLQYVEDAQTHALPADPPERALLAQAMGFTASAEFDAALEQHRRRVSVQFEQVFSTQQEARHVLTSLWTGEGAEDIGRSLSGLGYQRASDAASRLHALRSGSRYGSFAESSRLRCDRLVPRIIELAAGRGNPDDTLERCLALLEVIGRRAAYLALLDEHPHALSRLVELVSASSWASEYLGQHPIVLDELLDARVLAEEPDWDRWARALRRALYDLDGDAERQMDLLRESHHAQVFRLLAQDLAGRLSIERLADHLSDLADAVLQMTLELCWMQMRVRHRAQPGFAVIAYGKLGGKELGYVSDLDIIFLFDDADEAAAETYARLAQRLLNWLNARTGAGILFDTDLRLRPDGQSGMMVSPIESFAHYQRDAAWLWEHQALTRARFCAGDASTGAHFEAIRRGILRMRRDVPRLREEVIAMRERMLEAHPNASGLFDLKHDRGGMVDIEFIVQALVLAHAHAHPELVRNDGNIALLGMAAGLGLIDAGLAGGVQAAYRELRRRQHGLRLNGAKYARVAPGEVAPHIEATRALWRAVLGSD